MLAVFSIMVMTKSLHHKLSHDGHVLHCVIDDMALNAMTCCGHTSVMPYFQTDNDCPICNFTINNYLSCHDFSKPLYDIDFQQKYTLFDVACVTISPSVASLRGPPVL